MENPKSLRALVVGDAMVDRFVYGRMRRISDEAPVPVVEHEREDYWPGGAANVATLLAGLGARVDLCSVLGRDRDGVLLREVLADAGVEDTLVLEGHGRPTTVKLRVLAGEDLRIQVFRMDYEDRSSIHPELERRIVEAVEERIGETDLVVLADYGKGLLTPKVASAVVRMARAREIRVISSARQGNPMKYARSYLVKVNARDLGTLADMPVENGRDRNIAMQKLKTQLKAEFVLLIEPDEGLVLLDQSYHVHEYPPLTRRSLDVIGVGATVIAICAYHTGVGDDMLEAVERAALGVSLKMKNARFVQLCCADLDREEELQGEQQEAQRVGVPAGIPEAAEEETAESEDHE